MTRTYVTRLTLSSRATRWTYPFLLLLLLSFPASAQVTTGTPPFASFGGGPDVIILGNNNAHIDVSVLNKPGRGLPLQLSLNYDSSIWYPVTSGSTKTWMPVANWGWSASSELIGGVSYTVTLSFNSCNGFPASVWNFSNWTYYDAIATPHPFPGTSTRVACQSGYQDHGFTASASDSSGYVITTLGPSATLTSPQGNFITPSVSIRDRNGNLLTTSTASGTTSYYDTLSSSTAALSISGSAPNSTTFSYTPPSGTGSVTYTMSYVNYTVATNFGVSGIGEYAAAAKYLVDKITLPDNSFYQFSYEPTPGTCAPKSGTYQNNCVTARIAKVTLPTSGYISYSYSGGVGTNSSGIFSDGSAATMTRTLNDGTTSNTWTYARTLGTGSSSATRVTDPLNNDMIIQFQGIYETQRDAYNGSGPLFTSVPISESTLQTSSLIGETQTCYNNAASPCTSTAITLPITQRDAYPSMVSAGSVTLQSKQTFKYNSGGVPTEIDRYAFGSPSYGGLLQRTLITYASLPPNITSFRQTVTVLNGSGTIIGKTNYNYDQTTPIAPPTGTPPQWTSVSGSRGNLTSVQHCTNLTNCSTYLQTTMTYDTAGQLQSVTDPLNNQTTFGYSDSFLRDDGSNPPSNTFSPSAPTDAFVTKVTPPLNGAITYKYYYFNSALAVSTDQNQNSRWSHFDSLGRPSSTYGPALQIAGTQNAANPWTLINYTSATQTDTYTDINDSSTTATPSCTVCRHDQAIIDGFGRALHSYLVSDPDGQTQVDTAYDALSRVKSATHPYRSTGDPTYGVETPTYDALGRTIKVTHQNNSYSQTLYGATVTGTGVNTTQLCSPTTYGLGFPVVTIDEAGNKREHWTDALGRTIEGDEPDSSKNLTSSTCYSYDALGNLLQVVRSSPSQARTFVYDALSRVTSVAIPERSNCAVTSGYDSDSNLQTRTAPAPNQTSCSTTVTTTYSHDALNRLTKITYSSTSPVATPTLQYGYDGNSLSGCATAPPSLTDSNPKGHMTSMCDGSGAASWAHDAGGRIITEKRNISGIVQTLSYAYNLDSSTYSVTYPSGKTITYTASNAQRLTAAKDVANSVQFASAASYAAPGMLQGLITGQISGGFGGVTESHSYDTSFEYTSTQATSTQGTALNLSLSYNLTGGDNGTVTTITNNVDNGRTQGLAYDPLNRILSAVSNNNTVGNPDCWGQVFGPNGTVADDSLGNFTNINSGAQTQPTCQLGTLSVSVDGNNHINATGIGYDSEGNMSQDGSGYTYTFDAENRLVQASGMSGGPYCYLYDGLGLRVAKMSNANSACTSGTVTKLYWRSVSGEALAETDGSGNTGNSAYNEYVFFSGRRVSSRNGTGTVFYYFADQVGSVRTIATGSGTGQTPGQLCYDQDYTPYGQEVFTTAQMSRLQTTACPPNYKFTGYERDPETALDYAFARYYSSRLGRFLSTDPVSGAVGSLQSYNAYAYVVNNPVNLTDSTGLCPPSPLPPGPNGVCHGPVPPGGILGPGDGSVCTVDGFGVPCDIALGLADSGATAPCPDNNCFNWNLSVNINGQTVFVPQNYNLYLELSGMIVGFSAVLDFQSAQVPVGDVPVGMDIWHASAQCPTCGHIFTSANDNVELATLGETGLVGIAFSAPGVVTAAATAYGWGYGTYTAIATGVVALGSQADTELAALEDGVSRLSVSPGTYNFLNNMGQWWTVNQAFLNSNMFFGSRFIYVTDPALVWSGSWYLTELQYLH